jgi:spore coat polysaccharide biosynthesis protein SpsF (cytidylyltransferase family)
MGTFAEELTTAARVGQQKRKRLEEYEMDEVGDKLRREWKSFKAVVMERASSSGATHFEMTVDFRKNQEFFPSAKHLQELLPEDLEELRTAEGCYVRFEHGFDGPNTWKVIISCTGRVHEPLKDEGLEL